MKYTFSILFVLCIINNIYSQATYESPMGIQFTLNQNWVRSPKDIYIKRIEKIYELFNYNEDSKSCSDAYFQKKGDTAMGFPFIGVKNIYSKPKNENEIIQTQDYFKKGEFFGNLKRELNLNFANISFELLNIKYDQTKRTLIVCYKSILDQDLIYSMIAFYFGTQTTLQVYFHTKESDFQSTITDFIEAVNNIRERETNITINDYLKNSSVARKYFNLALANSLAGKIDEAIDLYSNAIKFYPKEDWYLKAEAYFNRGYNKRLKKDFSGAIEDYSEAILLRPNYYKAYNNRGYTRMLNNELNLAIDDFSKTIECDNFETYYTNMALGNRGIAKIILGKDGCDDLKKAIESGNKNVSKFYSENCK